MNYIKDKTIFLFMLFVRKQTLSRYLVNSILHLYQVLVSGTMGLSQNFISAATSSLFIHFVFVGTQSVVAKGRRTQMVRFAIFGYPCNGLLQKSLIISSWIAHLPVFQDPGLKLFIFILNCSTLCLFRATQLAFDFKLPSFRYLHVES